MASGTESCWADPNVKLAPDTRELLNTIPPVWQQLILSDRCTLDSLIQAVVDFLSKFGEGFFCPPKECIFQAMKYCTPSDIKVIIVGHDPVLDLNRASGLAFSYPDKWNLPDYELSAISQLQRVLKNVGILDREKQYSYCNEEWASRGVLLWNSCLTVTSKHFVEKIPHWDIWKAFTKNILLLIIKESKNFIFTLCWGTFAEEVGFYLLSNFSSETDLLLLRDELDSLFAVEKRYNDPELCIHIGHHPTFPRTANKFDEQARIQFTDIIDHGYRNLFEKNPLVKTDDE